MRSTKSEQVSKSKQSALFVDPSTLLLKMSPSLLSCSSEVTIFYMKRLDQINNQSVLFTPKSNKEISWFKAANLKLSKIKSFHHRYSSF